MCQALNKVFSQSWGASHEPCTIAPFPLARKPGFKEGKSLLKIAKLVSYKCRICQFVRSSRLPKVM